MFTKEEKGACPGFFGDGNGIFPSVKEGILCRKLGTVCTISKTVDLWSVHHGFLPSLFLLCSCDALHLC